MSCVRIAQTLVGTEDEDKVRNLTLTLMDLPDNVISSLWNTEGVSEFIKEIVKTFS